MKPLLPEKPDMPGKRRRQASMFFFLSWALMVAGLQAASSMSNRGMAYRLDLKDPATIAIVANSAFAGVANEAESPVLRLQTPVGVTRGDHRLRFPLPLDRVGGRTLLFTANIKAMGVTKPEKSYNGLKFQLHFKFISGEDFWKNPYDLFGTFDWSNVTFSAAVPNDAESPELMIGLEDSTGSAWIKEVAVRVLKDRPAVESRGRAEYTSRVLSCPVSRGVMSPKSFRPGDMRDLAGWRANLIRWQLVWLDKKNTPADLSKFDEWLDARLIELDSVLASCRENKLRVVVDLHCYPGGLTGLFTEAKYQSRFVDVWKTIATRYRGRPEVYGYDLLNEPLLFDLAPAGVDDWDALSRRAIREIRKIDPEVPVILETEEMASQQLFAALEPIPEKNIVYSLHFYTPSSFTHQLKKAQSYNAYPGDIRGIRWDKEKLRAVLRPVVDFQAETGARIFVGEFSAIRWAPGADQYLSDCVSLFDEYRWDWTYHAFREWDGWSVEHGEDIDDHSVLGMTRRKAVLLRSFSNNAP